MILGFADLLRNSEWRVSTGERRIGHSRKRLWANEDEWLDTFREYLCGHPELAEHVARIWFALLEHHDQGPEGVRNARFIINQALRLTYPFTRSYRLA